MSAADLSMAIQTLLSLLVLAFVMFSLWPNQRADLFRQQMFALRDELFDFALEGKIEFDNPAYTQLRELMNGFIRYAHNLTPYRTLMSYLRWKCTSREPLKGWAVSWEQALKRVSDSDTRAKIEEFHSKVSMLVMSQLVLSPGLLITFLPMLVFIVVLHAQWMTLRRIYTDVKDKVPMAFLEEEAADS
jgi:hypothetical protein